jgi:hypothetical protein
VVIDYLNLVRMTIAPYETDTPLVIDSDAMLPKPVTFQGFESVASDRGQIL